MSIGWRAAILMLVAAALLLAIAMIEPIPQDLLYHRFGDQRSFVGVPNFLNVVSNLPFLIVGVAGLRFLRQHGPSITDSMTLAWYVFFAGVALTAFGSSFYHLAPANEPLVWDRLPMTIAFMSLVAIVIAEYFSKSIARTSLLPLLLIGAATVFYWSYTESLGRGDLRPYLVVQFLPLLLIPLILLLYGSRSALSRYIWMMIAVYAAAKLAELLDLRIFLLGGVVSGHTLKHLIASVAPACLLFGLQQRDKPQ